MHAFTLAFLAMLVAESALELWLARRHVAHILAHRGQVPTPFAQRIGADAHARAADYTVAKTRMSLVRVPVDALVVIALTLGGGLEALDAFWRGLLDGDIVRGAALILSVFFVQGLVELPFEAWRIFVIDERFGFNRMGVALFVSDVLKTAALSALLGLPLSLAVLWVIEATARGWWLWAWFIWAGFNVLVLMIWPRFIAPLYNRFRPLEDASLAQRIHSLARRAGFALDGIYVMDGSRRSSHGNAYFTGLGKTRRIVLYDTLLERLSPEEIEAVLAHELGHDRRHHLAKRLLWLFATSLLALYACAVLIDQPWFYAALGVSRPSSAMGLALFFLVAPVFAFPLRPLAAWLSRQHEFEADAYAAAATSGAALVRALTKLYADNAATLTPDPLYSLFYDTHPPASLRTARLSEAPSA